MKVVHLSAADYSSGAGIACLRLHNELLNHGVESNILFLSKQRLVAENVHFFDRSIFRRLLRFLVTTLDRFLTYFYPRRTQLFSPGFFGLPLYKERLIRSADVIHLHWVNHGFVDISDLRKFEKPIVWTMHDCWPFTGGCHYFLDCKRFANNCGECPVLHSSSVYDISYWGLLRKERFFSKTNIAFVAISSWMRDKALSGKVLKDKSISIIPSGIDTMTFNYIESGNLRQQIGIDSEEIVILVGAQHLSSPFKGMDLTREVIDQITHIKLTILTFGGGTLELDNKTHRVINIGFVSNKEEMAKLYALSDIFLCTSTAEGFGMTVAEAQCCGTPAIAFKDTGPADIILHGASGYLADYRSIPDLITAINYCISTKFDRNQISITAIERFAIFACAEMYKKIYLQQVVLDEKKDD